MRNTDKSLSSVYRTLKKGTWVLLFAFLFLLPGVSRVFAEEETAEPEVMPDTIRVNCGGRIFTDSKDRLFEGDREFKGDRNWGYVGGSVGVGDGSIDVAGTEDDELFRSERWGFKEYRFHLKPGIYNVIMLFNDFYFKTARRRVFDILINGKRVVRDLDIVGRAGPNSALEITRTVSTDDGWIVVSVDEKIDRAKFSAIAIEPAEADQEAPGIPASIRAYPRQDEVGLEWSAVEANDLDGYFIYRSEVDSGDYQKCTEDPVADPSFVDDRVARDREYRYRVSAVDLFGNEGGMSEAVVVVPCTQDASERKFGINAGGKAVEDEKGRKLIADRPYTIANGAGYTMGGKERANITKNGNTEPFSSFQTGPVEYQFDVQPGLYRVTLGFADPWSKSPKDRVFDIYFNDLLAFPDVDLVADYGLGLPVEVQQVFKIPEEGLHITFHPKYGSPLLSFIYLEPTLKDEEAPEPPVITETLSRDGVVYLDWDAPYGDDVAGYYVLRGEEGSYSSAMLSDALIGKTEYVDHTAENDKNYVYKVVAVDASGNESQASAPVKVTPHFPTDDELLEMVSHDAFEYFMRECDPKSFLTKDKNLADARSVASIGFGLSALCIGAENGWVSMEEAERRAYIILRTLNSHKDNKVFGLFYHYIDSDGGRSKGGYEDLISTVDSALLMWGAVAAGEYFGGRVKAEADLMMKRMDWKAFANEDRKMVAMAYRPSAKRFDGLWDYYTDEALLITILGVSAPNSEFRLDPEYYYSFIRDRKNYKDQKDIVYTWPGALFTYTFAHCWLDFQRLGVDHPESIGLSTNRAVNWFSNTVKAVKANKEFCKFLSKRYKSFGDNAWGLTASSGPGNRYIVCGSPPCGGAAEAGHGTLALYGAGMAVPFLPEDALKALKHYYTYTGKDGKKVLWKDEFDGGYGLIDAFNLNKDFFSEEIHGINHGPMLLLIDNYRNGLMWKLCLKNEAIREGLKRLGFDLTEN